MLDKEYFEIVHVSKTEYGLGKICWLRCKKCGYTVTMLKSSIEGGKKISCPSCSK